MALYVNVDQLKASLANAGGAGARTAATLPPERLEANLAEAEAEVLATLSGFTLPPVPAVDVLGTPDDTVPGLFRTIILGIAGWLATLEFYGTQEVQERDPVVLRYARAKELLGKLRVGSLVIDGVTLGETVAPDGTATIYQGPGGSVGLADGWLADEQLAAGRQRAHMAPYSGGVGWE